MMKNVVALLCLVLLTLGAGAQTTPSLHVYADQSLGQISPYVYGSNFGVYSAIPAGYMEEAKASGVRYLRWGGGFTDERELTTGNIDTLIMNARIIGAEPAITVRLLHSTPEESAADVTYANITKGYGVRYWSIGNEPTLYPTLFKEPYDTVRYNAEWRAHALAMKAADPSILLVGPDPHQYYGVPELNLKDSAGRDWVVEFLKANGDLVDVVSIHRYPFPRSQADPRITRDDLRLNSREWDDNIIPHLRQVVQETTNRDLPIAVSEINSSWANNIGGEATLDSHYNAIWYADVLGRLIRQQVFIVGQWSFGGRDTSFTLLGGSIRPIYYTFQMYKHFGEEALFSASDVADVNVYAARRADGALTVMVVNMGYEEAVVPLTLHGVRVRDTADVWLFDPAHKAVALGEQAFDGTLTLSAESITLFVLYPDA